MTHLVCGLFIMILSVCILFTSMIVEEVWMGNICGMTEENESTKKSVPVLLCPPQIPHGLHSECTQAVTVRSWPLTA